MKFRLHYHVENNGDGSVSVHFHETKEAARQADSNLEEGWGEPCNGSVDLYIKNGKIMRDELEWDGTIHHRITKTLEEIE